jgi:hypothetical protein
VEALIPKPKEHSVISVNREAGICKVSMGLHACGRHSIHTMRLIRREQLSGSTDTETERALSDLSQQRSRNLQSEHGATCVWSAFHTHTRCKVRSDMQQ